MELTIKRLPTVPSEAQDVPAWLDKHHIDWNPLAVCNWPEAYPYQPAVRFRIAHADRQLVLHYDIEEHAVRAAALADNGAVWEDSCCEFFLSPAQDGVYYNLECNCAGTLLIGTGRDRHNRQHAPQEILGLVKRWSSLGREPIPVRRGSFHWQLALIIPTEVFFRHHITSLSGLSMRCNFYKCGDKLPEPHFLSWNPVQTESPDFHRPDYFASCHFADQAEA